MPPIWEMTRTKKAPSRDWFHYTANWAFCLASYSRISFLALAIRGKMLLPVDRHWGVSLYVPGSECPNEDLKKF